MVNSSPEKLTNIKLDIGNLKNNLKLYKLNSSNFSTKIGNNYVPGKYSDLELYCMNLINDRELISRKIEEYEELLADNLITEDDFIKRTTFPIEVAREFKNVKRYYEFEDEKYTNKDYFTGEIFPYSIDTIRSAAEEVRMKAKPDNDYKALLVIVTDDKNINDKYENINEIIKYFSENKKNVNPYNFYAATEGLASFSFDIESNIDHPKESKFNDMEINEAFNSNGKDNYTDENNILKRNHLKSFSVIDDKFIVLNSSRQFLKYIKNNFYKDNFFRIGFQKLLLNKFDYDIDYIILTTYPHMDLPFIFVNSSNIKENYKGSITLNKYQNIHNGPMLHELVHFFCNNIVEGQSCVVKSYQKDISFGNKTFTYTSYGKEYPNSDILGPHWGFTNTPGQLGGFNENIIEEITNNINYPVSKTDLEEESTINDIPNINIDENDKVITNIITSDEIKLDDSLDDKEEEKNMFNFIFTFTIQNISLKSLTDLELSYFKMNIVKTIRNYFNLSDETLININITEGSLNITLEIENIGKELSDKLEEKKNILPDIIQANLVKDKNLNNVKNISKPEIDKPLTQKKDIKQEISYNDDDEDKLFILILICVVFIISILTYFIVKS